MTEYKIKLDTVTDVKNFVEAVTVFDCHFDVTSGRYTVDAKSIMGIFSLDLSKPLLLKINSDNEQQISEIRSKLSEFAAE